MKRPSLKLFASVALAALLAGCASADRLASVGKAPNLSAIENPTAQPGYRPVQMPMPAPQPVSYQPNSLWRTGSRAFFKDQRAAQVGDLLTVRVRITDKAVLDNQTRRSRKNEESAELEGAVGNSITRSVNRIFGNGEAGVGSGGVLDFETDSAQSGAGSVRRNEQIVTDVAAVVVQVLPNGNLVIEGKQEVRVNFELRELVVAGVVRPEDIEAGNTIESSKIAQARIAYGGRGQITDVQQPRWGQQIFDIVAPF